MWHTFDIIADAMDITPVLRASHVDGPCRLAYRELIVRWFKDKSGKGQWPAVVDERSGIVIDKQERSTDHADRILKVEHAREQTVPVTLHMQLTSSANPWRSPRHWQATQTLGDQKETSTLGWTAEQGDWDGQKFSYRVQGKDGRVIEQTRDTIQPACLYALLADFPLDELMSNRLQDTSCDALFTEAMQQVGGATFVTGAAGNAAEHKLADGLTCYRLVPSLGFPLEFWVNGHGVVVYLVEAATRAWVLKSVEALL